MMRQVNRRHTNSDSNQQKKYEVAVDESVRCRIIDLSKFIVSLLIKHDYEAIETLSHGSRLSKDDLCRAISDYGMNICMLPDSAWDQLDIVEAINTVPKKYSVYVDLWTVEEGRSDLTMELTLTDQGAGFEFEVDDLHVL